jgi:hypothetical protein
MAYIQLLVGGTGFLSGAGILAPLKGDATSQKNLWGTDMVLKVERRASSTAHSIKGNWHSNDYLPVGADPCVRPELRVHTQVRPNSVFFYYGSL